MFRDHSLVPTETLRLTALGLLAEAPRRYATLASDVRHFTSRVAGPSPELMSTSLELLRHEGLVAAADDGGTPGDPVLSLTPDGRAALDRLLRAGLRAPTNDLAKLALALKLRFFHLLPEADRRQQLAVVIGACQSELARLEDLRAHQSAADTKTPLFLDWLDHEIAQVKARIAWLETRGRP